MKSGLTRLSVFMACFLSLAVQMSAFVQASRPTLPDFDERQHAAVASAAVTKDQQLEVQRLHSEAPRARVRFDAITSAPSSVSAGTGFLSGTNGRGGAISPSTAARFSADEPHRTTKAFLLEHKLLFGYGPEILNQARVKREFVAPHSGLRTVVWEQQVDGIPLFDSVLISHTTRRGELVNLSSRFLADPGAAADRGMTNRVARMASLEVSARHAVSISAGNIGEATSEEAILPEPNSPLRAGVDAEKRQRFKAAMLKGITEAKLIWLPMTKDQLRLCWDVVLMGRTHGEMYRVLVDAQTGQPLLRRCLTDYISDATYRVFTSDSPSPFSPGYSTPSSQQPPLMARSLLTLSALDTNASPNGWMDDGVNETRGNNVDAHTDWNADNLPDLPRPQGAPFRVFDFPLDLNQAPHVYSNAAVVQLFFWCNWWHDKLYELGFTEAAGNFQDDNFGRGGLDGDAVQADAQDGSGVNNANFSTPPDGSPGRMQMFIFNGPNPPRDGDLDAQVILHEHTHGLSNRRVGGGVGISALQAQGMGEGWSDFYSLSLLSEADDDPAGTYALGAYVSYLLGGLNQNYYFGIRRYPYCTDLNKNPLTFKDIDWSQASSHSGVPRNPVIFGAADEVHNMGEVWCVALWDARANLINKYGGAAGNQLMLQLVTDGMNLSPPNPNFLEARDAILQADEVDNDGTNLDALWAAFAKRGMGDGATSPPSTTTVGVYESFDLPDDLRISLASNLSFSSPTDGPLSPDCRVCWLSNLGSNTLAWAAYQTDRWFTVSENEGTLAPGATNAVTICLTEAANWLSGTNYTANLVFSNAASGITRTRAVTLLLTPPRVLFLSLDADPGWPREGEWAFGVPAGLGGSENGYPDPSSGATGSNVFGVNLAGDYSTDVGDVSYLTAGPFDLSGYTGTQLQFQRWLNTDFQPFVYETIDVSSDGVNWNEIWENGPSEIADDAWVNVSYDISTYADNGANVYVRWGHRVASPLAYAYSGWNIDDIGFIGNPTHTLALSIPQTATEGDAPLLGTVGVSPMFAGDLIVTLTSSDTSSAMVPDSVTIPAGQSNATFSIAIVGDAQFNGTRLASIKASAPRCKSSSSYLEVLDNLNLVVTVPAEVSKNAGVLAGAGSVRIFGTLLTNLQVSLSSSDPNSLEVPSTVTILAGQTEGAFDLMPVANPAQGGDRALTITASAPGFGDGTGTVVVLDDNAPPAPSDPFPADGETNVSKTTGLAWQFGVLPNGVITNEIYFGTNPVPGLAELQGFTTNSNWTLPPLAAQTTYYWQVISHLVGTTAGPVWHFSTSDLDHFSWEAIPSPQYVSQSFAVTLSARDVDDNIVSNFSGSVNLHLLGGSQQTANAIGGFGDEYLWPTNSGPFDAGRWSGFVSVLEPVSNATLLAEDGELHSGSSIPFSVVLTNDISITASGSSDPVAAGGSLVYTLVVSNSGTADATGVMVTNILPSASEYHSAATSQGSCTESNGIVVCDLGIVPGATNAVITITIIPLTAGVVLTNSATVSRAEVDPYLENNRVVLTTAVEMPPLILVQPINRTMSMGGTVSFSVVAEGTEPLSYQWSFNGTNLLEATDALLVLTNVQSSDAGNYAVLVTNEVGFELSSNALLTVQLSAVAPTIVVQPTNQTVFVGDTASFSVVAEGTEPLSYQWSFNGTNLLEATDALLVVTNVQLSDAGNYAVLVTNEVGFDLSSNALLTVQLPAVAPVIVVQPTNQTVFVGDTASFSVVAEGTEPLSYQWSFNGTNLLDATDALLVVTNVQLSDAGNYAVLVTNEVGFDLSSNALLTVQLSAVAPTIVVQPTNQAVFVGDTASFSVVAEGTEPLSYQWSFNGTNLLDATDALLVVTNVQLSDAGDYAVLVTNEVGFELSSNALLTVQLPAVAPVIVVQPTNQTVFVGDTASFSVVAEGTEPLSYQWSFNGTNLLDATDALLVVTNVQLSDAGDYAVLVTNEVGLDLSSNALLTVQLPPVAPTIVVQPTNLDVFVGGTVSFSVVAEGTEPLSYQWSFNGTNLLEATDALLVVTNVQWGDAGTYSVRVSNSAGSTNSTDGSLSVYVSLTATATAGGAVYKYPDLTVYASGSVVSLIPAPILGWNFSGWSGGASGTANPLTVTLYDSLTVTANFTSTVADLIVDNTQAADTGTWTIRSGTGYYSNNFQTASTSVGSVTATMTFTPAIVTAGYYDVYAWYPTPSSGTTSTNAQFLVSFNGGTTNVAVDQQTGQQTWRLLASGVNFAPGTTGFVRLSNNTGESNRRVLADAVRWVYAANQSSPPVIIAQPQNQTVDAGGTAIFTSLAVGTGPLSYQWRFNGMDINGATDSAYTLSNLQSGDAGSYAVLVTNEVGFDLSSNALLTVQLPAAAPTIVVQPTNQAVFLGDTASFSVVAEGTEPLNYRWSLNGTNLPGATNALLVLTNVQMSDAGSYVALVANEVGFELSSNALLTVQLPAVAPTIVVQPTNLNVLVGDTATFSVVAEGTEPLTYQWSFNGTNLLDATDALLVVTNVQLSDAGDYAVLVTNEVGFELSSNALLTVQLPAVAPTIVVQPTNQAVLVGDTVSFSVVAEGTELLSYQWSFNGTNLLEATDALLVVTNVQLSDAGNYAVLVTNELGFELSSNALLTVQLPAVAPTIVVQPTNQAVLVGDTVSFSVVAEGTELLSYQWSFNGTNLLEATDALLVVTNVQLSDAGNYAVLVTNEVGFELSSNALLTVQLPAVAPTIVVQPTNQAVLVGDTVSFSVVAEGTELLSYQWSFNGTNLLEATDALLVVTNVQLSDAGNYAVLVTNEVGFELSSNALLTVQLPAVAPTIVDQPTNQTVFVGDTATFSVVAEGTEPLSYQWSFNGTNLLEATDALLVVTNVQLSDAGIYAVLVTNEVGFELSSNALLTVQLPAVAPTIVDQPTNQTVFVGDTATFSVVAEGTEPLSYQWSFNGTNLLEATDALLVVTNVQLSDAGIYAVLVTNEVGFEFSSNALLTVQLPAVAPTIVVQPTNQTLFVGDTASFSVVAEGTEPLSYQWSFNGTNLLEATDALLMLTNVQLSDAGNYAVLVTNEAGFELSSNALLTVQLPAVAPTIMVQPVNRTMSVGGTVSFSVVAEGTEPLSYQWSFNGANLLETSSARLVLANVQLSDAGNYAVLVTNEAGFELSSNALLTVQSSAVPPTIVVQPTDQTLFAGDTASFSVVAEGTEPLSYQWSLNGTNLLEATDALLVVTNVQLSDAGNYAVLVTNEVGFDLSSNALLTVQLPAVAPVIVVQPTNQAVFVGDTSSFSVVAEGTEPLSYQWSFNGTNLLEATDALLVVTNVQLSDAGNYAVLVTNEVGFDLSSNALLTVQLPAVAPVIVVQPTNQAVLVGNTASFSVVAEGTEPLSYQWSFNGTNLLDATDALLVVTNVQLSDAGNYAVLVTNEVGFELSSNALLTVQLPPVAPVIVVQPTNQTVFVGDTASFSVVAEGTEPLSYQWSFNGTNLLDATDALLVVTNVQLSDAGNYAVLVSNEVGLDLSSNALLTVQLPPVAPTIVVQPTNLDVFVGGTVSFSVVAEGTEPLSYQWSFNGTNLLEATDALLVVTNVQWGDAGLYSVVVSNGLGSEVSTNASLLVYELDHFVWNPISSPCFANIPFVVTIQAQDASNRPQTNFHDTVTLKTTNGFPVSPTVSGNFVQGEWTGSVAVSDAAENTVLLAEDGYGHVGFADPVNVIAVPQLTVVRAGNTVLISWPATAPGFVLESSTDLSSAVWAPVRGTIELFDGKYQARLRVVLTNGFYRLRYLAP